MDTFHHRNVDRRRVDRRGRFHCTVAPVARARCLFVDLSDGAVDGAIRDAQRLAAVKSRVRGDLP
jgi:hypothetical protein